MFPALVQGVRAPSDCFGDLSVGSVMILSVASGRRRVDRYLGRYAYGN